MCLFGLLPGSWYDTGEWLFYAKVETGWAVLGWQTSVCVGMTLMTIYVSQCSTQVWHSWQKMPVCWDERRCQSVLGWHSWQYICQSVLVWHSWQKMPVCWDERRCQSVLGWHSWQYICQSVLVWHSWQKMPVCLDDKRCQSMLTWQVLWEIWWDDRRQECSNRCIDWAGDDSQVNSSSWLPTPVKSLGNILLPTVGKVCKN